MDSVTAHSLEDMFSYAQGVLAHIRPGEHSATVLALSGDLGAGKTAFAKGIARALGIIEQITSPTFVIQKSYPTHHEHFSHLVHIDAYRLNTGNDLGVLRWNDTLADPKTLVCLEWPEHVKDVLPANTQTFFFETIDETTRKVTHQ